MAAPKALVWSVISDAGNYHRYATGLHDVKILSGEQEGMVRSCTNDTGTWSETCTDWQEGERYTFEVHTEADDYPFPLKTMRGTWFINSVENESVEFGVQFDYQLPYRWMHWLYNGAVRNNFKNGAVLDNWKKEIEQRAAKAQ